MFDAENQKKIQVYPEIPPTVSKRTKSNFEIQSHCDAIVQKEGIGRENKYKIHVRSETTPMIFGHTGFRGSLKAPQIILCSDLSSQLLSLNGGFLLTKV